MHPLFPPSRRSFRNHITKRIPKEFHLPTSDNDGLGRGHLQQFIPLRIWHGGGLREPPPVLHCNNCGIQAEWSHGSGDPSNRLKPSIANCVWRWMQMPAYSLLSLNTELGKHSALGRGTHEWGILTRGVSWRKKKRKGKEGFFHPRRRVLCIAKHLLKTVLFILLSYDPVQIRVPTTFLYAVAG